MLKFTEFLNEESYPEAVAPNPQLALSQLEKLNNDLEKVTSNPFMNSAVFLNAVRGTLERYGVQLPNPSMQMLSREGEYVYSLGDSHYVYIVFDSNSVGAVEGYAQVVDEDELNDVVGSDFEAAEPETPAENPKTPWIPPDRRKAADDSGNTNEY